MLDVIRASKVRMSGVEPKYCSQHDADGTQVAEPTSASPGLLADIINMLRRISPQRDTPKSVKNYFMDKDMRIPRRRRRKGTPSALR
jgi:hypothetical protein